MAFDKIDLQLLKFSLFEEFDSTHRSRMLEILKAYGIPEKIVRAIGIMYSSMEAKVRSADGDTDFF
eukprot:gene10309-11375_t